MVAQADIAFWEAKGLLRYVCVDIGKTSARGWWFIMAISGTWVARTHGEPFLPLRLTKF